MIGSLANGSQFALIISIDEPQATPLKFLSVLNARQNVAKRSRGFPCVRALFFLSGLIACVSVSAAPVFDITFESGANVARLNGANGASSCWCRRATAPIVPPQRCEDGSLDSESDDG